MPSTSRALASFSMSGGLHELRNARVLSVMTIFMVADLSFTFCRKYDRIEGDWVTSMMVSIEDLARLITTLLVRPHRASRGGIKMGSNWSNWLPIAVASALRSSIGQTLSLVRSEFIALVIGLWAALIALTSSVGLAS